MRSFIDLHFSCYPNIHLFVVGRVVPPTPDVHTLVPGAYVYVTLYGKRDISDVTKDFVMER